MTSLGDAMLLGLSNVLCQQIIVFTSIPSWPHFTIYPRSTQISENPIHLHVCLITTVEVGTTLTLSKNWRYYLLIVRSQSIMSVFHFVDVDEEEMQKNNCASTVARIITMSLF